jgi:protein-S-isoprenylcysteine O-methyltransferase Ste14
LFSRSRACQAGDSCQAGLTPLGPVFASRRLPALGVWARRHLGCYWSGEIAIKVDHRLIRSGPYRFVRHPIYTAMLGMFAGTAVVSGQLHAALGLAMAGFAYWRKIRLEEANLRKAFGPEYDAYRRATGSLVPKLL